jgi:5-methylcytosine-specific restriction endonuclease McrA
VIRRTSQRRITEEKCDTLFSLIVRARDAYRCRMCGYQGRPKDGIMQCAHGWERDRRNTRFDLDNAWTLCRGCHKKYTHNFTGWTAWMRKNQGDEKFEQVWARAQITVKLDYAAVWTVLQVWKAQFGA